MRFFRNFLIGNCICHKLVVYPVVEAFRTDSSYSLHSCIVFDVKQSWECVPLPCLDGLYSKISWFFFVFGMFRSRKQRFFKSFCLVWMKKRCFWLLFICQGCGALFIVALGLWEGWKPCFLVPVECFGRGNAVPWNILLIRNRHINEI